jgi:hypothetical protein
MPAIRVKGTMSRLASVAQLSAVFDECVALAQLDASTRSNYQASWRLVVTWGIAHDCVAANILLKELNDKYKICICEGNKYMEVNHVWIKDEKLIEQKLINICADLNIYIYIYIYCSSENPTEQIVYIDGNQYYLNKFEAYSANYTSAKNIVKLVYDKLNIDNKLNNKIYISIKNTMF